MGVTICIVDESGNLLFLEKGDGASLNTLQFAQKKARDAAAYGSPSREAAECGQERQRGRPCFSKFFPNQGGLPIRVDGQLSAGSRPAVQSPKLTNKLLKQGWTRS